MKPGLRSTIRPPRGRRRGSRPRSSARECRPRARGCRSPGPEGRRGPSRARARPPPRRARPTSWKVVVIGVRRAAAVGAPDRELWPRSTARSSLIARRPPADPTRERRSSRARRPRRIVAPDGEARPSSLARSTTKAPSRPCGRPTRPTATRHRPRSVGDLEQDARRSSRARRAHERAQRTGDAALAADHLADVVGRDVQPQHDRVVPLDPSRRGPRRGRRRAARAIQARSSAISRR